MTMVSLHQLFSTSFVFAAAVLLAGCASRDRPTSRPDAGIALPSQWVESGAGTPARISTGWLKTFRDRDLEAHVAEAMAYNRTLGVAAARLQLAHEDAVGARARRLPSIGFRGNASRSRAGNGPDEEVTRQRAAGLSLDASWELDLWGRLRHLDRAARADVAGSEADFRAARLSLAANVAKAWFDFIAAEQQALLAETTRDSFLRNQRITERNYKAGDESANAFSVQIGRSNVSSAERSLVRARLERSEAARDLEVLVGRYPEATIKGRDQFPTLPSMIPAGLPSELLSRRPDLVAGAAELLASSERADAARKDLLPSINLNGGPSSSSRSLDRILLDPEYFVWSIAAGLAQQVYEGGAPTAAARRALVANEIAVRSFADLCLRAFREVESALATERSLAMQENFLDAELKQANLAEAQAARDYSEGLVDIISLLEAQRRAVSARIAMINVRTQRLRNRVDLHLALGGDFATLPDDRP